jgi:hypothetical protein
MRSATFIPPVSPRPRGSAKEGRQAPAGGNKAVLFLALALWLTFPGVAMSRKTWPILAMLFGFAVIAATVWYIILGVKHPSGSNSITIALLSAIGVPIALGAIAAGYRGFGEPDAATLKTEADARRRASEALEDAETAEKIRSELEAYVIVRTFRLEIERERQELSSAVRAAMEMLAKLNQDEALLGAKKTELDPIVLETLDPLLQSDELPEYLDSILSVMPSFMFVPIGPLTKTISRAIYGHMRQRQLRRLARLAPDALADPGRSKPDTGS